MRSIGLPYVLTAQRGELKYYCFLQFKEFEVCWGAVFFTIQELDCIGAVFFLQIKEFDLSCIGELSFLQFKEFELYWGAVFF